MKGIEIKTHTNLAGTWKHFLPVPLADVLKVVKERIALPVHEGKGKCNMRGLKAFFCVLRWATTLATFFRIRVL